jgi:acetylornithine/succinyldiaminopimelate/putrescine aminotransferase
MPTGMIANQDSLESILRSGFDEFIQYVNPLIGHRARMVAEPIPFREVRDGHLVFQDGTDFEDFHGTQPLGHRNPHITQAAQTFLASSSPNWFPSRVSPYSGRFARRLCEKTGGYYSQVYFAFSGSDAVESALKMARAYARRPRLLGLENAYHGCGMGAVSLMAEGPFREPFGPHLPGALSLPIGDIARLQAELEKGDVAGIIVEPIQSEGGMKELPADYVAALCALTEQHDVLLIADELQTGLGRSGHFLMTATWPRRPDVVLLAKHLGGGLMPISATMSHRKVFERAYGRDFEDGESHNQTFNFNALGAVTGLATLDLLTDELMTSVGVRGEKFAADLREALTGLPLVKEVRGKGFMLGVELVQGDHPWLTFEHFGYPELAGRATIGAILCQRLFKHGFFTFVCGHRWEVLRLQPRFEIPDATLTRFVKVCREEIEKLCELI